MKIEIEIVYPAPGKSYVKWNLTEGPEYVHGFAVDLIQAFVKILEWQEKIEAENPDLRTIENTSTEKENATD